MTRHQRIARQRAAGVPVGEIAAEFGLTVPQVLQIDRRERERQAHRKPAGPPQAPKPISYRTARPAEERWRERDITCRAPDGCGERIHKGSYCAFHRGLYYVARAA